MDFTLTDEQVLLRDSARSMLAAECPTSLLRAHMDDRAAADPLWRHLSEWTELGRGPLVDLCLFLEELGAVAAPGPFLATTTLFAGLGLEGVGSVALAGAEGQWAPNPDPLKTFVVDADMVDHLAFVLDGPQLAVMPRRELDLRPVGLLDSTRRVFEVTAPEDLRVQLLDREVVQGALDRAWIGLAAEMLGAARWIFDATLAYVKERVQFDRPIGSFQAVQHKLANVALARERAWSAVYYAAMAVDAGDPDRHRAAHIAKAAAGEAATTCAREGVQLHGGIGFTWEHDLHLFVRRVLADETLLGTTDWHHDRLADLILT